MFSPFVRFALLALYIIMLRRFSISIIPHGL